MTKRLADEQIVRTLHGAKVLGVQMREVCRKEKNATEQTFFRWQNKYGGHEVADTRRLRANEAENARLKKLVVEHALVIDTLKVFSRGK